MKLKPDKLDIILLVMLTLIPFVIIALILYPYASGVHGTTYSEGGNEYQFIGNKTGGSEGHFKGDYYVGENTGWVFCNSKVRYNGELHINNAEFDYKIQEEDHFGSFFDFDYQEISINGDLGEMQEGFPYYFLGLLGSAVGLIFWFSWMTIKNNPFKHFKVDFYLTIFVLLILFLMSFYSICCSSIIILIGVLICSLLIYNDREDYFLRHKSNFLKLSLITGLFSIVVSIFVIILPNHYTMTGLEYRADAAIMSIIIGTIGLFTSAGLLGLGVGRLFNKPEIIMD